MFLLTLRYFATGSFQRTGGDLSGVSVSTSSRIIRRVCFHIAKLRERFISFPSSVEKQRELQNQFYKLARFPRVIAAIDCTHVEIISPGLLKRQCTSKTVTLIFVFLGGEDAELYRNRKGFFSINTQTLCDSKLNIMDIVCRWPGSTHDATILRNSRIFNRFEAGEFRNCIVVGDSGYPCNRWLMTPLARITSPAEALYNESQIRSRNCIERKYGVWKRRFPVLSLGIRVHLEEVEAIVVATAVLHNVCNLKNDLDPPPTSAEISALIESESRLPLFASSGQSDDFFRRQIIENHFQNL